MKQVNLSSSQDDCYTIRVLVYRRREPNLKPESEPNSNEANESDSGYFPQENQAHFNPNITRSITFIVYTI